jgi:hypothetical protein
MGVTRWVHFQLSAGANPVGYVDSRHSESSTSSCKLVSVQVRCRPWSEKCANNDTHWPTRGRSVKPAGTSPHVSVRELVLGPTQICWGDTLVARPVYRGPSPSPRAHAVRTGTMRAAKRAAEACRRVTCSRARALRSRVRCPPTASSNTASSSVARSRVGTTRPASAGTACGGFRGRDGWDGTR